MALAGKSREPGPSWQQRMTSRLKLLTGRRVDSLTQKYKRYLEAQSKKKKKKNSLLGSKTIQATDRGKRASAAGFRSASLRELCISDGIPHVK